MATDMIDNEPDLITDEIIATSTTSTLSETAISNYTENVALQLLQDNVTASRDFNATNFTSTTTLPSLLNGNVTLKAFEGSLSSAFRSENVTFVQEGTSSRLDPLNSSSTSFPAHFPVETSSVVDGVHTLFPDSFNWTTSGFETTSGILNDVDVQPASVVGIAVGVAIGGFMLLALIVAVIVFLVRRRKILRKKQSEIVMENPTYKLSRDSTLPRNFDLTMHTGPMMRNQLNNNSAESLSRTNGKRKKEAPQPPIYRPLGGKETGSKRKAPPPPRLGGVEYEDLYEKDSATGSIEALELTSFGNHNADPIAPDPKASPSQPLLVSFKPGKKSPKRISKVDSVEQPAAEDSIKEDDESKDEDEQMKTALLGKTKADSKLSLDSYDKEKNPFFGD